MAKTKSTRPTTRNSATVAETTKASRAAAAASKVRKAENRRSRKVEARLRRELARSERALEDEMTYRRRIENTLNEQNGEVQRLRSELSTIVFTHREAIQREGANAARANAAARRTEQLAAVASAPIRVLRLVEYTGPRDLVEAQIKRSLHGTRDHGNGVMITAVTLHEYPEVLENARQQPADTKALVEAAIGAALRSSAVQSIAEPKVANETPAPNPVAGAVEPSR